MRRARVVKRTYGWVVELHGISKGVPGAWDEHEFEKWADALAWAVRMVGA